MRIIMQSCNGKYSLRLGGIALIIFSLINVLRVIPLISILTAVIIFTVSCGRDNKSHPSENPLAEVKAKRDRYIELAKETVDGFGWLLPKCDGLLFNSLAAYSNFPSNPLLAEKLPGLWERHPSFSCYPEESRSSISKDMFRGLFLFLLKTGDRGNIQEIKDYCDAHEILAGTSCAMGEASDEEAYYGRVVFGPAQRLELNRMLGLTVTEQKATPYQALKSGFEAHLDVLRIYTSYKIVGGISDGDVETLKAYAEASPRNSLFQILYHKFTDGRPDLSALLDESLFPADRLPTSKENRCAHYLWQRDDDEDWQPCDEGLTHPGIDLMFAVKLLEE